MTNYYFALIIKRTRLNCNPHAAEGHHYSFACALEKKTNNGRVKSNCCAHVALYFSINNFFKFFRVASN